MYKIKRRTLEELEEIGKQLDEMEIYMDKEEEIIERQIELRERKLDKLAEDVTLDDILNDMEKDSLCRFMQNVIRRDRRDLSVFRGE